MTKVRVLVVVLFALVCGGAKAHAQGQGPTQHKTSLSWTASTSSGITNYCVYRGTVSGGPYTNLACPATTTSYVDLAVIGGNTYYYVVTAAVGATESVFSNEAKATIPLSPAAPTGLVATVQ